MFRLAMHSFIQLCRNHRAYFALSLVCLTSVFVSFIFLQERGYVAYQDSLNNDINQTLCLSCDDRDVILTLYSQLNADSFLPEATAITLTDGHCAGVFWNREKTPHVWYTPYGRFFTDAEMQDGASVMLLSTAYLSNLSTEERAVIWQTGVTVNDITYQAIGNYTWRWVDSIPNNALLSEALAAGITLPLNTFLQNGFTADSLRIVFSEPFTKEQVAHLQDIVQQAGEIYNLILPVVGRSRALYAYWMTSSSSSSIILLALLTLTSVIVYWLEKSFARYHAYLICGAQYRQIAGMLLLNAFFLVTLAFLCSFVIMQPIVTFMPNEILLPMPWFLWLAAYLGLMLFTLAVVFFKSRKMLTGRQILRF